MSVRCKGRYGQAGRKYLKGPDGLEQREEAILDQLSRLKRCGMISERTTLCCRLV